MDKVGLEIVLVVLLVLANGIFSMSEMALVSSRKARLRQRSEEGNTGARLALELSENPNDFLSTVQIGITLIGTLAGAFGGATIAEELAVYFRQFPAIAPYSDSIGIGIVVLIITYLSLIFGELVPKNIALSNPEAIAGVVAKPMRLLAGVGSPVVKLLTASTRFVMKLLPIRKEDGAPVTEEEIKVLIAQGTQYGTFAEAEQEMVEGVFWLGDRRVTDLMTPRNRVVWLDVEDTWEVNKKKISESLFSRFLVAEGDLDRFLGAVHVKDLFIAGKDGGQVDLRALARKPLFVPETKPAIEVLNLFQQTGGELAVVIDEHGAIEGIISLADLVHAVIGNLKLPGIERHSQITKRDDGSWLADGSITIADLVDELSWREVPGDEEGFTTLGGFVFAHLHKIPSPGEHFVVDNWRFEVIDMDGNRVDKVLISKQSHS